MSEKKSNRSRAVARINSRLDKNLAAYMAAAGAAGVSLLATAKPAEAKVVYTAANEVLTYPAGIQIDLNHDGTPDFVLGYGFITHIEALVVKPTVAGNAVRGAGGAANAGFFGVPVGPGEKFVINTSTFYGYGVFMAGFTMYTQTASFGPWAKATNRYLGFKFMIGGVVHYGWARITVGDLSKAGSIVLTGYAYETTPNTTIVEGHLSGPEKTVELSPADLLAPFPRTASLGMLARGVDALSIWRRDEEILIQ
jgi:hypothetical protein